MTLPDDATPHAIEAPMRVDQSGKGGGTPVGANSTKVAWTIRNASSGDIEFVFDWAINPQGITRTDSSRAQVFSTKAGHYVNDFGPGPAQISIRQIVASGRRVSLPEGLFEDTTRREDVQRFIKKVWLPAIQPVHHGRKTVYFHDNHLEQGHDEKVMFPPNGLSVQRAVDLQGVWLVEIQMIGLEVNAYSDVFVNHQPRPRHHKYVVKRGDTLHKIAVRVAGRGASAQKVKQVLALIIRLNPEVKHRRTLRHGDSNYRGTRTVTAKPYQVVPGEVLILPGGPSTAAGPGSSGGVISGTRGVSAHGGGDGAITGSLYGP